MYIKGIKRIFFTSERQLEAMCLCVTPTRREKYNSCPRNFRRYFYDIKRMLVVSTCRLVCIYSGLLQSPEVIKIVLTSTYSARNLNMCTNTLDYLDIFHFLSATKIQGLKMSLEDILIIKYINNWKFHFAAIEKIDMNNWQFHFASIVYLVFRI